MTTETKVKTADAPPSAEDVDRILGCLTPAQRATLLGERSRGFAKPNLFRLGVYWMEPRKQGPRASPRFNYVLTELGHAVTAALRARAAP